MMEKSLSLIPIFEPTPFRIQPTLNKICYVIIT